MANNYFQFKRFIIRQDRCAMKVCTDACILGAWFAQKMGVVKSILDIGSGSGLLMMMLAQKSAATMHGIEVDPSSFEQSLENIRQAGANDKEKEEPLTSQESRLNIFYGDAREFPFPQKYDFIISNPPFYHNDLHSLSETKNKAKHSTALDFTELLTIIGANLSEHGTFGVLLPFHRWEAFDRLASARFQLIAPLFIRQSSAHDHFRAILHYRRRLSDGNLHEKSIPPGIQAFSSGIQNSFPGTQNSSLNPTAFELIIKTRPIVSANDLPANAQTSHQPSAINDFQEPTSEKIMENEYSPAFIDLLKDYYLRL